MDQDMLLDYVMGALTPDEERAVAAHLSANPEDAAYARDLFEVMAETALSLPPEPLPEDAEAALLARIRQPRPAEMPAAEDVADDAAEDKVLTLPRRTRPAWWLGLAAAAAVLVAVFTLLRPPDPDTVIARQLERTCAESGVVCAPLAGEQTALGTIARRPDNRLLVVLDDAPPAGQVYQAWEIADGTPRSVGVFEARVMSIEEALAPGSAFGITVEPPGGSAQPTSTPIAVLEL